MGVYHLPVNANENTTGTRIVVDIARWSGLGRCMHWINCAALNYKPAKLIPFEIAMFFFFWFVFIFYLPTMLTVFVHFTRVARNC